MMVRGMWVLVLSFLFYNTPFGRRMSMGEITGEGEKNQQFRGWCN